MSNPETKAASAKGKRPPPPSVHKALKSSMRLPTSPAKVAEDNEAVNTFLSQPLKANPPAGLTKLDTAPIDTSTDSLYPLRAQLMTNTRKPVLGLVRCKQTHASEEDVVFMMRGDRTCAQSVWYKLDTETACTAFASSLFVSEPKTPCNLHPWFMSLAHSACATKIVKTNAAYRPEMAKDMLRNGRAFFCIVPPASVQIERAFDALTFSFTPDDTTAENAYEHQQTWLKDSAKHIHEPKATDTLELLGMCTQLGSSGDGYPINKLVKPRETQKAVPAIPVVPAASDGIDSTAVPPAPAPALSGVMDASDDEDVGLRRRDVPSKTTEKAQKAQKKRRNGEDEEMADFIDDDRTDKEKTREAAHNKKMKRLRKCALIDSEAGQCGKGGKGVDSDDEHAELEEDEKMEEMGDKMEEDSDEDSTSSPASSDRSSREKKKSKKPKIEKSDSEEECSDDSEEDGEEEEDDDSSDDDSDSEEEEDSEEDSDQSGESEKHSDSGKESDLQEVDEVDERETMGKKKAEKRAGKQMTLDVFKKQSDKKPPAQRGKVLVPVAPTQALEAQQAEKKDRRIPPAKAERKGICELANAMLDDVEQSEGIALADCQAMQLEIQKVRSFFSTYLDRGFVKDNNAVLRELVLLFQMYVRTSNRALNMEPEQRTNDGKLSRKCALSVTNTLMNIEPVLRELVTACENKQSILKRMQQQLQRNSEQMLGTAEATAEETDVMERLT